MWPPLTATPSMITQHPLAVTLTTTMVPQSPSSNPQLVKLDISPIQLHLPLRGPQHPLLGMQHPLLGTQHPLLLLLVAEELPVHPVTHSPPPSGACPWSTPLGASSTGKRSKRATAYCLNIYRSATNRCTSLCNKRIIIKFHQFRLCLDLGTNNTGTVLVVRLRL